MVIGYALCIYGEASSNQNVDVCCIGLFETKARSTWKFFLFSAFFFFYLKLVART